MRPESKEYLFYALQLVAGFFIVFELCNYWPVFPTTLFRLKVLGLSWVAVNVAHPMFLHRIYELDRKKVEIALTAYLAVMVILALSFTDPKWVLTYGIVLIVLTTAIGFYNLSCHFTALYKKHPYAKRFSFFGISVILGAIHDGFVYFFKFTGVETSIFGYSFHNMIFHYGAAALYVGTALVLVARFMNMMEEVEDLNTNLENFIIENALLNERLKENSGIQKPQTAGTVTITDKTEEKVKQVINYVKANYSSDISREGLAASVDVHPDNLGKLFKIYTDKKLGDYINELRITEAATKLIETEDSIINIAFLVGFESLRTFNRIFPKYMKTTPEKYRKEYKK
jgi:AraC-like DNA-binding protein